VSFIASILAFLDKRKRRVAFLLGCSGARGVLCSAERECAMGRSRFL